MDLEAPAPREVACGTGDTDARLDRALAAHPACVAASLSRERLKRLIQDGAVTHDETPVRDPAAAVRPGRYRVQVPAAVLDVARAQAIPLTVLFEDAHLIVIDKPAGLAVHPGAGIPDGTLVNALLAHCGPSLAGVGGVARPGIVHRLDKDTSGVMVAAKTDAAHHGLSTLFAAHDIDRVYLALTRGAPAPAAGVIVTRIGRSPHDRQKMAVLKSGGREAITHYKVEATFGSAIKPAAARVSCRLETGRTHQIRVHLASRAAACLGDPVYGGGPLFASVAQAITRAGLARQALHAAVLGFVHPVTREALRFETAPPEDMHRLEIELGQLN